MASTLDERQRITVQPDNLHNIVLSVTRGDYRIPEFQRDFVWEQSRISKLFDSIYKEFPIGTFFIWQAGKEYNSLFRPSSALGIKPVSADDSVSFVLDGQQRLTALYLTLKKQITNGEPELCFDAKKERFIYRQPNSKRFLSLREIWGGNIVSLVKQIDPRYSDNLEKCYTRLKNYPISLVTIRDQDLSSVCDIFQRINQSGKRLDRFDLIVASSYQPDFDLRKKFIADVATPLTAKHFGEVSPGVLTQLIALLVKGACGQKDEFALTADDFKKNWANAVSAILLAADTLRANMGVKTAEFLPYDAVLTLSAYVYAKSSNRTLTSDQIDWLKRWFWTVSFAQYFGSAVTTKMAREAVRLDDLLKGSPFKSDIPISLSAESLVETRMTWARSAIRNAYLCLLAAKGPTNLMNSSALDLSGGTISDFSSPEKHHIFPQAHLKRTGAESHAVQALPNFCFLTAALNKKILDSKPSDYFPELKQANPNLARDASTHLIPLDDTWINNDDYPLFLQMRAEGILEEIERLTGLSTAPAPDERIERMEKYERILRDEIDDRLSSALGSTYWKTNVPTEIRQACESRFEKGRSKDPKFKNGEPPTPRILLNFCNTSDYVKVITNGRNWPYFEPLFHRADDVTRHLESFTEFRNALAHNRPLSELVLRAGELSLVWLQTQFNSDDQQNDSDRDAPSGGAE